MDPIKHVKRTKYISGPVLEPGFLQAYYSLGLIYLYLCIIYFKSIDLLFTTPKHSAGSMLEFTSCKYVCFLRISGCGLNSLTLITGYFCYIFLLVTNIYFVATRIKSGSRKTSDQTGALI